LDDPAGVTNGSVKTTPLIDYSDLKNLPTGGTPGPNIPESPQVKKLK
jgi:hypothetical protein